MNINIKDLIKNPESIDDLLSSLDKDGRDVDGYEYGLPLYAEGSKAIMRNTVLQWLLKFDKE